MKNSSFRALVLALAIPIAVLAQGGGGSVTGTVTDTSNAVIPNAEVELANKATGVLMKTTSTTAGQFVFPVVPIGNYTATVTAQGFTKAVQSDVKVDLNQNLNLDFQLRIGAVSEQVEVSASSEQLQTGTNQQATTIDSRAYDALPLSPATGEARSPTAFIFLAPGVSAAKTLSNTNQAFYTTVNGGQNFQSEVQVDGASIQDTNVSGDLRNLPFPPDAVNEFTLVTSNYSAEYGRTGGGILTYVTKSGTNGLHGAAYEYIRNNVMDARGFFAQSAPVNRQNEFGGNFGGPVILPKLYNGRNKTFFFFYYDGFRYRSASTNTLFTIPTPAMRTGDFSNFRDAQGNVIPIYDPTSTTPVTAPNGSVTYTRQQFPGNIIPGSRVTAVAQKYASLLPPLIFNQQNFNAADRGNNSNDNDQIGGRFDHNLSDRHHISVMTMHGFINSVSGSTPYTGVISGQGGSVQEQYVARINDTVTIRPNLVNQFTAGYNRNENPFFNAVYAQGLAAAIGISGVPQNYSPGLGFSGYPGSGGQAQRVVENSFVFNDFLSWTVGRYTWKAGVDYRRFGDNTLPVSEVDMNFSPLETADPSTSARFSNTGNSWASFLIGAVDQHHQEIDASATANRFQYLAEYLQGDIKVNSRLTLNLGLRYDIPWTRTEVADRMSTFNPSVPNPGASGRLGAVVFAGKYGYGNHRFADVYHGLVQPRFGFAYKLDDKTVVRGGYAVFAAGSGDTGENGIRVQYGNGFNSQANLGSLNGGITPAFYYQNGVPQIAPNPPFINSALGLNGSIDWLAKEDGHPSVIQNWNFGVQRQLPAGILLEASYVANKANHLGSGLINTNQVDAKYLGLGNALNAPLNSAAGQATGVAMPYPGFTGTVAQALRPYPQYQSISRLLNTAGNSTYESLQVRAERRFQAGFALLASYTYSKVLTDAEAQQGWFDQGPEDNGNRKLEKALSRFDVPQVLTLAYTYELPVGKGKALATHGVVDAVAGGWAISMTHRYQSGYPLSIGATNTLGVFSGSFRPNIISGTPLTLPFSDPARDTYINRAAFSTPAPFTFGNAPRTISNLRGFPFYNEDAALSKHFRFWERVDAELRLEAFNLLNRVVFNDPNTNFSDTANFGKVNGQTNRPRVLQAGLHIRF